MFFSADFVNLPEEEEIVTEIAVVQAFNVFFRKNYRNLHLENNNKTGPRVSGSKYMKSLRRVVQQFIQETNQQLDKIAEHIQMARAYRPVSQKLMPRWRNLGRAITPYHFMRPAVVPVQHNAVRKTIR